MTRRIVLALALLVAGTAVPADALELRGSRASMVQQNRVARENGNTFFRTPAEIRAGLEDGRLVPVEGNEDYELARVSHPVAAPEVRLFVERLGAQYRRATGEKLVVTSLTRPTTRQPANAHALSVHPAGLAVDLRVPANAAARRWLESTLIALERQGVLDATRERNPPHYHVAIFPQAYRAHVDRLLALEAERERLARERAEFQRLEAERAAGLQARPAAEVAARAGGAEQRVAGTPLGGAAATAPAARPDRKTGAPWVPVVAAGGLAALVIAWRSGHLALARSGMLTRIRPRKSPIR